MPALPRVAATQSRCAPRSGCRPAPRRLRRPWCRESERHERRRSPASQRKSPGEREGAGHHTNQQCHVRVTDLTGPARHTRHRACAASAVPHRRSRPTHSKVAAALALVLGEAVREREDAHNRAVVDHWRVEQPRAAKLGRGHDNGRNHACQAQHQRCSSSHTSLRGHNCGSRLEITVYSNVCTGDAARGTPHAPA